MNWFLPLIFLTCLFQAIFFAVILWYSRLIWHNLRSFVVPIDAQTPTPLSIAVDGFIGRLVERFKVTIMGVASGQARAEQAALAEATEAAVSDHSPLMGVVMSLFPKSRKLLLKNPALMATLLKAGGKVAAAGGSPPADNGQSGDYANRLNRYGG